MTARNGCLRAKVLIECLLHGFDGFLSGGRFDPQNGIKLVMSKIAVFLILAFVLTSLEIS